MATDGEGGNPGGRGPLGMAMNALRGARTPRSSKGAWNSGGMEFDTKGVREFTTEIGKAEKGMGAFVKHFKELDRILRGMDQKKLDALAAVGSAKGGGGSFIDASPISAPTAAGAPARHDASTDNNQSTGEDRSSPGRGHNTNRFGGASGGVAGAYFLGELIQRAGGRLQAVSQDMRQDWGGFDYANNLAAVRSGRSYNSFSGAAGWRDLVGATGREDAFTMKTRSIQDWGTGVGGAAHRRFDRQVAALNLINPSFGGATGAREAWNSAFGSPEAQWAMIQQGLRPAAEGGAPRAQEQMFSDIILRAAGKSSFEDLSRREAQAMFSQFGQGRRNLSVIAPGMSPEMIDAVTTMAVQASGGQGINHALNSRAFRNTIVGTQMEVAAEDVEKGAEATARGRESLINVIEGEGKLRDTLQGLTNKVANITPYVATIADKLAGGLGGLATAGALLGDNTGEGGGGAGGVVRTATDFLMLRRLGQIARGGAGAGAGAAGGGLLGRAGGFLGGRVLPGVGLGLSAYHSVRELTGENSLFKGKVWRGAYDDLNEFGEGANRWIRDRFSGLGGLLGDAEASPDYRHDHRISWEHGAHLGDGPLPGPGRTAGLKPDFLERLKAMFAANPRLTLTSGFRTKAEQTRLWNNRHSNPYPVARPGTSSHESGYAADVGPRDQLAWVKSNAPKFGLNVPLSNDPVHVTPLEGAKGKLPPTQQPQGEEVSGGAGAGAMGGGFQALHKFATGFVTSTSSLIGALTKAPGFEHGFGGGGGGGGALGGVAAGGAAAGSNGAGRSDILAALRAAGFSGESLRMAYAIGMAESSGNTGAVGDVALQNAKWGPSIGFFQIRSLNAEKGKGTSRDATRLKDINFNARSAWEISGGGKNWQPWSVYKSGAYKSHYDAGIGDAEAAGGGGGGRVTIQGGGGNVRIDNVSLSVTATGVSEAEATRLAKMVMAKIEQEAQMKALGGV